MEKRSYSKRINRKPEPVTVQGPCVVCGIRKQKTKGGGKFAATCTTCEEARRGYVRPGKEYTRHKGDTCAHCGFVCVDPCQMDVDHIDNNHKNNDPSNLQTLCANCHRLKSRRASFICESA